MPKPLSLENPFVKQPPGNPDTASYVEKVLGKVEADKYRKLNVRHESLVFRPESLVDVEMTDEERERAAEREKEIEKQREAQEKRETRKNLIEWAMDGLGMSRAVAEVWTDKNFIFFPSGEAEIESFGASGRGLVYLPKGAIRVRGSAFFNHNALTSLENLRRWTFQSDLHLQGNALTDVDGLPQTISSALNLSDNPITSLEGLPRNISRALYLMDIPATSIPSGLNIDGSIYIRARQKELIADARSKGYKVEVVIGR